MLTLFDPVHYAHIDHNALRLLPPTFCITTLFDFYLGRLNTRRNREQWLYLAGGGGGGGLNKVPVYCGLCENGEFKRDQLLIVLLFKDQKRQLTPHLKKLCHEFIKNCQQIE